jgi:hypothetical protein
MVRAYLDDSGKLDDPNTEVIVVAGCIAKVEDWEKFDPEWLRVLKDFGVREFHLKDLAHRKGDFKGWDESRRKAFSAGYHQSWSSMF